MMKYKDYIKESSTLVISAIDDIITMFKKKKVTEIEFSVKKKSTQGQYCSYLNTMNKVKEHVDGQMIMSFEDFEAIKHRK